MKNLFVAFFLLFASAACGQQISPLNSECSSKKCVGSFTLTNDGILPITVDVQAVSLSLNSDGSAAFRPLDNGTDVQLSSMSARLGPRESYVFDYRIKCATPCMVDFAASMITGHTDAGVALRIVLNDIVYLDAKGKGARVRALKAVGYLK